MHIYSYLYWSLERKLLFNVVVSISDYFFVQYIACGLCAGAMLVGLLRFSNYSLSLNKKNCTPVVLPIIKHVKYR